MMRMIWTAILSLSLIFILCGCVSRSQYEELVSERNALLEQTEELTREVEALKNDVSTLQDYAKELFEENEELSSALEAAESAGQEQEQQLRELKEKIAEMGEKAKALLPQDSTVAEATQGMSDTARDVWGQISDFFRQNLKLSNQ